MKKKRTKSHVEIATYTVEYFKKDGFDSKVMTCDEVNAYMNKSKRRFMVRNNKTGQVVMSKVYKG